MFCEEEEKNERNCKQNTDRRQDRLLIQKPKKNRVDEEVLQQIKVKVGKCQI